MKEYVKNSFKKSMKERKEYYLYDIPVYILNPLPDHLNMDHILDDLRELVKFRQVFIKHSVCSVS